MGDQTIANPFLSVQQFHLGATVVIDSWFSSPFEVS
jgi:hypothetical protein